MGWGSPGHPASGVEASRNDENHKVCPVSKAKQDTLCEPYNELSTHTQLQREGVGTFHNPTPHPAMDANF